MSTDDILCTTDVNSYSTIGSLVDTVLVRQRLTRASSTMSESPLITAPSLPRPIGIAEPVRRLSAGLIIRAFKRSDDDTNNDKSVQVNTIIRSCGRCAGSSNPSSALAVKKHVAVSSSPSSPGEMSSGCEDDDVMPVQSLQPPNLDRLRQRRATLVAKTIINQMATQPPVSMIDEPMPALTLLAAQRHRTSDPTSMHSTKHPLKKPVSPPPPPSDPPRKRGGVTQEEFLEISKQISSLLTPSDDEN